MEENKEIEQPAENNTETIFSEHEFSMEGYDKHIRQARNACFAAAGVLLLNVIILAFTVPDDYAYLWLDVLIWGAFIAGFILLGFWTKKKPYYAIVSALILYSVFIILNAVIDISSIYKGIIFKVAVIVFLVKGLKDAKAAQEMNEQFKK
jgi:hypothetical protein